MFLQGSRKSERHRAYLLARFRHVFVQSRRSPAQEKLVPIARTEMLRPHRIPYTAKLAKLTPAARQQDIQRQSGIPKEIWFEFIFGAFGLLLPFIFILLMALYSTP